MDLQRKGLMVIARMALQDGVIEPQERETLETMAGGLTEDDLSTIIEEARTRTLDELLTGIDKYEDRFLIAMRAYLMAHSDQRYDLEEEMSFDLLVERFQITIDDLALIIRIQKSMSGELPISPEPRLMELHKSSSFFSNHD